MAQDIRTHDMTRHNQLRGSHKIYCDLQFFFKFCVRSKEWTHKDWIMNDQLSVFDTHVKGGDCWSNKKDWQLSVITLNHFHHSCRAYSRSQARTLIDAESQDSAERENLSMCQANQFNRCQAHHKLHRCRVIQNLSRCWEDQNSICAKWSRKLIDAE